MVIDDWREVPCCYSLHEIEQKCPRTGQYFWPKDESKKENAAEELLKKDWGDVWESLPNAPEFLHGFTCEYCTGSIISLGTDRPIWQEYKQYIMHMDSVHSGLPLAPPMADWATHSHK